ncbi:hypothetical protein CC80DRAFT_572592 [Byssothecium circinans]|uniref:Uncharacterized protein n=1 Tax=Byssothecium circinans TaxID=147558 RepID=A0A6A5TJR2_9PLEO|nr:hypothetical protein CC80DRAFT_572592 [Byssothecium circinans]
MSNPNSGTNTNGQPTDSPNPAPTFYDHSTELADLGRARFDHDVAAFGDRDTAAFAPNPVFIRQGRAAAGMEDQVHAWNTFQYATDDKNEREALKGDLHGGQLHRENRAARGEVPRTPMERPGRGGGGRGGRMGVQDKGPEVLTAGRKGAVDAPPLAKGYAKELGKEMFWDGPIV